MEIAEIRHATGLSQRGFSAKYGIPLGTLRNWEQGIANPPAYVLSMLERQVNEDTPIREIITSDVVNLLEQLSLLTRLSSFGFKPVSEAAKQETGAAIYFDETTAKTVEGVHGGYVEYRIAKSIEVVDGEVQVTSYWDSGKPYAVKYEVMGTSGRIEVVLKPELGVESPVVIIKDGKWRVYSE